MSIVREYYDAKAEAEWTRLERHGVEHAITLGALEEYLPAPPARVADIGGGPGRYAIELTRRGYAVTLSDLSDGCLELARVKAAEAGVEVARVLQADACDLGELADESFDAALLMGPLYHLLEHKERLQAVRETARVLRPGGVVFSAIISRYAPLHYAAAAAPEHVLEHRGEWETIAATGVYRRDQWCGGFIDAWFAHPTELAPLMEAGGFEQLDLLACEPLVNEIEEKVNATSGELWDWWQNTLYTIARDPSLHGSAAHVLYVGRKAAAN